MASKSFLEEERSPKGWPNPKVSKPKLTTLPKKSKEPVACVLDKSIGIFGIFRSVKFTLWPVPIKFCTINFGSITLVSLLSTFFLPLIFSIPVGKFAPDVRDLCFTAFKNSSGNLLVVVTKLFVASSQRGWGEMYCVTSALISFEDWLFSPLA